MASQMVGTLGLTSSSAAAYYLASGRLDQRALILWAANWCFASNQIHFVQLRIHGVRARTIRDKVSQGRWFLIGEASLLAAIVITSLRHWIPPLVALAFVPAFLRGIRWYFQ